MSRPPYAPFADGRWRLTMGLLSLDARDWIQLDDDYRDQLAEKERLRAERHGEVFAALPGSVPGQTEVLWLLADHLPGRFPDCFEHRGDDLVTPDGRRIPLGKDDEAPLDRAGRLVQEDLCLMTAGPAGYVLAAASLCFPGGWRLADKLGRPMADIHGPVPGYDRKLARPIDRFFSLLKPGRPVQRVNWSLPASPDLFSPVEPETPSDVTGGTAGARYWLRCERQTLRRLPASGDILFTIKTYIDPLSVLEARPELAAALRSTVAELPDDMLGYKHLTRNRPVVLAYLDRISGAAAAG